MPYLLGDSDQQRLLQKEEDEILQEGLEKDVISAQDFPFVSNISPDPGHHKGSIQPWSLENLSGGSSPVQWVERSDWDGCCFQAG